MLADSTRSLAQTLETLPATVVHEAIWCPNEVTDWPDFRQAYLRRVDELKPLARQRVGLAFTADRYGLTTLAALNRLACDIFLFDHALPELRQREWQQTYRLATVIPAPSQPPMPEVFGAPDDAGDIPGGSQSETGSVTILTSGTTGRPKAVRHDWRSLTRPVRPAPEGDPQRWLLAFRPHLYAGLQVILQALLNRGTLVAPPSDTPPIDLLDTLLAARVQFASATPSYWRRLLLAIPSDQWKPLALQQITLGGEVVDQPLLDQLAKLFPAARIAHIYATTELGRCFAVSDRLAGFPAALLEHPTADGVELRVVEGQLWVRSANAMQRYDTENAADDRAQANHSLPQSEWFPTGDLVEQEGDRIFFAGRNSDLINVGGNKVSPLAVENVIRQLDGVAEVRVYGQASSLAGQLVACQVVPRGDQDEDQLRQQIRAHCAAHLDRLQCPRIIEVVERLELSEAGKLLRRP